jgi:putative oxidoreductase
MNTALWIVQGLLAVMFVFAGFTKLTQSKAKLEKQFPWVKDFSISLVRLIGLAEILGAFGLIVPWLTRIAPILTPVAAVGFCIIMVLAARMAHLNKKEYKEVALNIFLFLLAAFVAYGRF